MEAQKLVDLGSFLDLLDGFWRTSKLFVEHNSESITLGWSWGLLGAILKPFRRVLGSLGAVWEALGVVLGALGAVLGWSWELLGRS